MSKQIVAAMAALVLIAGSASAQPGRVMDAPFGGPGVIFPPPYGGFPGLNDPALFAGYGGWNFPGWGWDYPNYLNYGKGLTRSDFRYYSRHTFFPFTDGFTDLGYAFAQLQAPTRTIQVPAAKP